jgi:dephospho-CoA kinase
MTKIRHLKIGLTGGIGSGKSEALKEFARQGAATLCLDESARRVMSRGGPAHGPVVKAFGSRILGPGGEIDRGALGRLVFASSRLRRKLERLTHPAIISDMRRWLRRQRRPAIVDAPLLFEAGLEKEFDLTMVVTAGRLSRLKRLRRRDRLPVEQLRRHMAAQLPLAEKARRADVVIPNEGSRADLRRAVREYYQAFGLMHGG